MDTIQNLLQISARFFKQLSEDTPKGDERSLYIDEINRLLDDRGNIIENLRQQGFKFNENDKTHVTLAQLDKGIRERLDLVMNTVKQDMKDLQNTKKHEKQYMNPYSTVQVMDGMYYDKKK
ncbi:Flagellar protein FliT OS=Ureibacillus acetophenoni OX=614649 GN=SAMN05877842_101191 PE=4 SV=1 [Ureibacillus acetophenoni]